MLFTSFHKLSQADAQQDIIAGFDCPKESFLCARKLLFIGKCHELEDGFKKRSD